MRTTAARIGLVIFLAAAVARADWEAARSAFESGDFPRAVKEARGVVEEHPDYAPAHYLLGVALFKLERFADAAASLEAAVELGEEVPQYAIALAQAQVAASRPEAALATLQGVDAVALPQTQRSAYVGALTAAATSSQELAAALPLLRAAVEGQPESPQLWRALGRAEEATGRHQAASAAYLQAFRQEPEDATAGLLAVQAAIRRAQAVASGERLAAYRRAAETAREVAVASDLVEAWLLAGEAHLGAREFEAAREAFGKALAAAPQVSAEGPAQGEPQRATAHYYLGRCALVLDEPQAAVSHLEQALAAGAGEELARRIHAARGHALHALERYEDAAEAYARAGEAGKAAAMREAAEAALVNREIDAKIAACRAKKARLEQALAENEALRGTAEWRRMQQDVERALAECRPYLEMETPG